MTPNITFSCQKLLGTNKAGILKPDADGYWTVLGGGFNITTETNDYYPFTKYLEGCFKSSSAFMRRVTRGHLRGELSHPVRTAEYNTDNKWFARLRKIDFDRSCMHIGSVTLDFSNYRSHMNEAMIACILKIRPMKNQYGEQLLDSLNNPKEDTCFSVRTLTLDIPNGLSWIKQVYEMITWDYVPEPGVRNATKYHSPGLESLEDGGGNRLMAVSDSQQFSPEVIRQAMNDIKHGSRGTGMEGVSDDATAMNNLMNAYGMTAGKDSQILRPSAMRW